MVLTTYTKWTWGSYPPTEALSPGFNLSWLDEFARRVPPGPLHHSYQAIPRRVTETDALLSTHPSVAATSGVPPGAVLILTFENDTLRRENNVLAEVADLSGKGLVGKVEGALVVAGKVGNGLELGDDRYLEIKGEFPSGKQSRTFAAWFKQTENEPRLQFALTQGSGLLRAGLWHPGVWSLGSQSTWKSPGLKRWFTWTTLGITTA